MQTRGARVARGVVAAVAATATAAASHTLAGAEAPAPAILALATAFAAVVCVLLSGRTLSLARLAVSVLLSQLAYHSLFLVTGGGGDVSVVGATAGGHFHGSGTVELVAGGAALDSAGHSAHTPLMLVSHLVAALVTVAALRHAERVFWTLGTAVLRVVVRLVARASALLEPLAASVAVLGAVEPSAPRALDAVLRTLRHRGPPARALPAV
ncbi:hypothetical protein HQQ82_10585 [Rathayibacter sp. VKM Ac-2856]|uniref:hypothetical protein n=1 Tax=unclassified Rathayibacter TaxID=2609250 RepID=UPI001564C643|nr:MULTISPECIES: hypothetical protein [unclassified Rathayibacter]NQX05709.1 hypothetical protein [Rathayibacter sp. VKM Ac-2858]NQX20416.1 hypothetical protein [Rathayibacter sp. VKM Ac-2856]